MKVLIDEVLGQEKFKNELVVSRIKKSDKNIQRFNTATDMILFYTKSNNGFIFNPLGHKILKKGYWHALDGPGQGEPRLFFGKKLPPPPGRHWMWDQETIDEAIERILEDNYDSESYRRFIEDHYSLEEQLNCINKAFLSSS